MSFGPFTVTLVGNETEDRDEKDMGGERSYDVTHLQLSFGVSYHMHIPILSVHRESVKASDSD